jgi:ApaG protein
LQDIRVRVKSGYVVERSNPSRQQYFFAYRIRISNEGTRTVQLVNRHWTITDATGRTDEVR